MRNPEKKKVLQENIKRVKKLNKLKNEFNYRGVEQPWLARLITLRSAVQICPPQPNINNLNFKLIFYCRVVLIVSIARFLLLFQIFDLSIIFVNCNYMTT